MKTIVYKKLLYMCKNCLYIFKELVIKWFSIFLHSSFSPTGNIHIFICTHVICYNKLSSCDNCFL